MAGDGQLQLLLSLTVRVPEDPSTRTSPMAPLGIIIVLFVFSAQGGLGGCPAPHSKAGERQSQQGSTHALEKGRGRGRGRRHANSERQIHTPTEGCARMPPLQSPQQEQAAT